MRVESRKFIVLHSYKITNSQLHFDSFVNGSNNERHCINRKYWKFSYHKNFAIGWIQASAQKAMLMRIWGKIVNSYNSSSIEPVFLFKFIIKLYILRVLHFDGRYKPMIQ